MNRLMKHAHEAPRRKRAKAFARPLHCRCIYRQKRTGKLHFSPSYQGFSLAERLFILREKRGIYCLA
ncbi:hypothetical protein [Paraburkholderia fynbosensis]|uniref:hypothetical protein n=1 Tax=Paraburkholderia fynbosensis TaxID=1200993 RepID=UPI0015833665|nr:hypothetical protein [Paraburkholderia fynbosensis]